MRVIPSLKLEPFVVDPILLL